MMSLHSRRKLKPRDAERFRDAALPLFGELAQVICQAGVLPEKELHECWQMACLVHQRFPRTLRVADIAAGHGLLGWILVLLARTAENPIPRTAVAVDIKRPKSADLLAAALTQRWPQLADSLHFVEGSIDAITSTDGSGTLFVAAHACGSLSDRVLMVAMRSRSPVAIMPCCHSLRKQARSLSALALASGLPADAQEQLQTSCGTNPAAAFDAFRTRALTACGYEVREDSIQALVTSFNRIVMGDPSGSRDGLMKSHPQEEWIQRHRKRLGETRAYETMLSLNVADSEEVQALSRRPSREWIRSFDLSYWVDEASRVDAITEALEASVRRMFESAVVASVHLHDHYTEPATKRLAFTWRIVIRSSTISLSRADAARLRAHLCQVVRELAQMLRANVTLRGEAADQHLESFNDRSNCASS